MDKPRLTLIECLKQSLDETPTASTDQEMPDVVGGADEPQPSAEVVDLFREKVVRGEMMAKDITPQQLIEIVAEDIERLGNVVKCYVTLIADDEDCFTVSNYRAGLNRVEEVSFRQLGVQEAVDNWRFGTSGME